MRTSGGGPQYAELLEAAGVDTVRELAQRNAANLTAKLTEVNSQKKLGGDVAGRIAGHRLDLPGEGIGTSDLILRSGLQGIGSTITLPKCRSRQL